MMYTHKTYTHKELAELLAYTLTTTNDPQSLETLSRYAEEYRKAYPTAMNRGNVIRRILEAIESANEAVNGPA